MYIYPMEKRKHIFSERLIALRKAKGLTQAQLAEQLNVTCSKVAYLESRTKNPTTKSINLVADFFQVPPEIFLQVESERIKKNGPLSQLEERFEKLKSLPRSQQKVLLPMLDGLISSLPKS
jgi:transcriptional regulator with XRE-family HTH domain